MKTLVTALVLAILIAAPASVLPAQVTPADDRGEAAGQRGPYQGYPLTDWYRTETSW